MVKSTFVYFYVLESRRISSNLTFIVATAGKIINNLQASRPRFSTVFQPERFLSTRILEAIT